MSFCQEQKKEIIQAQYKGACCRRALLSGMLAAKGEISEGRILMRLVDSDARKFASELIFDMYSKNTLEISGAKGGRGKILCLDSRSAEKYISDIRKNSGLMYNPRCGFCRSSFLRGVFLASGRVSEPQKQYSLEFTVPDDLSERFLGFFADIGIEMKVTDRSGTKILYTKNSVCIEDFFGLASMNTTAFSIMNSKIKSELRNEANRIANCEMSNINKAVGTAMRQIGVISRLEEAGLLGSLPDELAMTARLRLEYNSLSLSQLAAKFTPSISKPGLSHRLNKIEELAKKLLADGKN